MSQDVDQCITDQLPVLACPECGFAIKHCVIDGWLRTERLKDLYAQYQTALNRTIMEAINES